MTLAFALLVAAAVPAAPVPEPKLTAEKAVAWDKLWVYGPYCPLLCHLLKEPRLGVVYLRGKLTPIKLGEAEAKDLLAKLGSDTEEEWQAAYNVLRVRDVRLAMTLSDAWAELKTPEQRRRLAVAVTYWGGRGAIAYPSEYSRMTKSGDYTLVPPAKPGGNWRLRWDVSMPPSHTTVSNDLAGWQKEDPHAFNGHQVRLMLRTLEAIGTPEARAVVEKMATGHPDVDLTKEAAATGKRMKAAVPPPTESRMAAGLRMLHFWQRHLDDGHNPAGLAAFMTHPDQGVAFLRANLRPLKMTHREAVVLLNRLFADDPAEARAAFRQFQRTDIRAAMPLREAWTFAATPDHRGRLVHAIDGWYKDLSGDFPVDDPDDKLLDYELRKHPDNWKVPGWCAVPIQRPGTMEKSRRVGHVSELGDTLKDAYRNGRWNREADGLHILDVIGTADAVAVIRDVATGHPDAYLTQAAKRILKSRN